jgi:hypothetical protein
MADGQEFTITPQVEGAGCDFMTKGPGDVFVVINGFTPLAVAMRAMNGTWVILCSFAAVQTLKGKGHRSCFSLAGVGKIRP